MLAKIYGMLWLAVAMIVLFVYLAGSLTMTAVVVFGFVAFGLVFMGMMGVLPATVVHTASSKPVVVKKAVNVVKDRGSVDHRVDTVHA